MDLEYNGRIGRCGIRNTQDRQMPVTTAHWHVHSAVLGSNRTAVQTLVIYAPERDVCLDTSHLVTLFLSVACTGRTAVVDLRLDAGVWKSCPE